MSWLTSYAFVTWCLIYKAVIFLFGLKSRHCAFYSNTVALCWGGRKEPGSCSVTEQQCHQVARMRTAACFVRLASNIGSDHEAQVNLIGMIWAEQGSDTGYSQ